MSEENLAQSLGAAGEALEYLVASLERAGFGDNAPAYEKMAEVLVGQRMWAEEQGIHRFDTEFHKVGGLGRRLRELIDPYGRMARTLIALLDMVETPPPLPPDTPEAIVLVAMGDETLSMTAISSRCEFTTSQVRRMLAALVESGTVVERRSGSRTRYQLAGGAP